MFSRFTINNILIVLLFTGCSNERVETRKEKKEIPAARGESPAAEQQPVVKNPTQLAQSATAGLPKKDAGNIPEQETVARRQEPPTASYPPPPPKIQSFCGSCHPFPNPNILPDFAWPKQIETMYDHFQVMGIRSGIPATKDVFDYYLKHAPKSFPAAPGPTRPSMEFASFQISNFTPPGAPPSPALSSITFSHHFSKTKLDILVSDLRHNMIFIFQPYLKNQPFTRVAQIPFPGHSMLADLDQDGIQDVLVAGLGSFGPTDRKVGALFFVKGISKNQFSPPIELITNIGRVPDIQAVDLDGDKDLDLVVSEFGKWASGGVFLMENLGESASESLQFRQHKIDGQPGCLKTEIADINKDGKLDVIALFAQGAEEAVAFLQQSKWSFTRNVIHKAPHPAWGYNDFQLADMDGDSDMDVVTVNGDMMDDSIMKPYHSVTWHENKGTFPFEEHMLYILPGAGQVVTGDLDGDGDLDIVATGFVPAPHEAIRVARKFESIVILEQEAKGQFSAFSLEKYHTDHAAIAMGDYDQDGHMDLAVGNFAIGPTLDGKMKTWVKLYRQTKGR
jgi:hypothetical protein